MDPDRLEDLDEDSEWWSVSKLQTLEGCGRRFKLRYRDRLPDRKSAALHFGTVVHKLLDTIEKENIRELGTIQRLFDNAWWPISQQIDWSQETQKKKAYENKADKIFNNYLNGPQFETVHLEQEYKIGWHDLKYRGIIDRVVMLDDGEKMRGWLDDEVPLGELAVIDYKTSKNPPDWDVLHRDPQLTMYWLGAKALDHCSEVNYFGIYHLLSGEIYWTHREEKDLLELEQVLHQAQKKIDLEMFERNVGFQCKWCPFKEVCLSKEGV